MGKEDVKRALEAMVADDTIAAQMAEGDFSGVEGLELSDEERVLVRDAAADVPEVAGFAVDMFLKLDGIKGESKFDAFHKVSSMSHKWNAALKYSAYKI